MKAYAETSLIYGPARSITSRAAIRVGAILLFTLATAMAAQVRIPLPGTIVPMTLQSAVVLMAGLRLGRRDGAISQILYVGGGAAGLPFFAGASGFAELFGPTGGYLLGFVLAAYAAGGLEKRFGGPLGGSFWRTWAIAFVASLLLFIPGLIQLRMFTLASWSQTFMMGFLPFMLGDVLKVTLAAALHGLGKRYFI